MLQPHTHTQRERERERERECEKENVLSRRCNNRMEENGKQKSPGRATSRSHSQPLTPGGREKVTQSISGLYIMNVFGAVRAIILDTQLSTVQYKLKMLTTQFRTKFNKLDNDLHKPNSFNYLSIFYCVACMAYGLNNKM